MASAVGISYRKVSSSDAVDVDDPVGLGGMALPLAGSDEDGVEDVGDRRFNIPSSPIAPFHAFKPPIKSIGGFFKGRWNSFSNIALDRVDIEEFADPSVVDF